MSTSSAQVGAAADGDVVGSEVVGEEVGEAVGPELVGKLVGELVGSDAVGDDEGEPVGDRVPAATPHTASATDSMTTVDKCALSFE